MIDNKLLTRKEKIRKEIQITSLRLEEIKKRKAKPSQEKKRNRNIVLKLHCFKARKDPIKNYD